MSHYIDIYRKNVFTFSNEKFTVESIIPETFDTPWGIITAWNPNNCRLRLSINRSRNRLLNRLLKQSGYENIKGKGGLGKHSEESYLVEKISLDDTLKIGRKFRQYSIYWCDGISKGYYRCADSKAILLR